MISTILENIIKQLPSKKASKHEEIVNINYYFHKNPVTKSKQRRVICPYFLQQFLFFLYFICQYSRF